MLPWNGRLRFCRNFSLIATAFTNLLNKNQKYEWSLSCRTAFQAMLSSRPILMVPDLQKPLVDASDIRAGCYVINDYVIVYCL